MHVRKTSFTIFRTGKGVCVLCKVIKRKRINCVKVYIYFSRVNRNTQISWTYKNRRKSHDQCINLYYFYFFFVRSSCFNSYCLCDLGAQNNAGWNKGGCRRLRKAWHIWGDSRRFSPILSYIIYYFFFVNNDSVFLCRFFVLEDNTK